VGAPLQGATLVAKYCRTVGDYRGAIEFLLLAKKRDDSFQLAAEHNEMGLYVQALRLALAATAVGSDPAALMAAAAEGDSSAQAAVADVHLPTEECLRIATFYEQRQAYADAAKYYTECAQYHRALKLYLQCGDTELDRAIDVVGKAKSEVVTHTLIDYLMGETDGVPKDPHYIFKLYMALGSYTQAAKTALIIARQEQELGNYKVRVPAS
jgi:WD repeat-containing protein 19